MQMNPSLIKSAVLRLLVCLLIFTCPLDILS